MMNRFITLFLFCSVIVYLFPVHGFSLDTKIVSAPISHQLWNSILKENVSKEGLVDYQGINSDQSFQTYLDLLAANHPNDSWTKNEQLAYWINAYNAFTVKLIIDNWPVSSIKDISSPWKKSFIKIDKQTYSLNDIEHEILRKRFNEPRIHFAINCASFSCPVLAPYAFQSKTINVQLDEVTSSFMNDPKRNEIGKEVIRISKIFKWFTGDFTRNGTLAEFIDLYTPVRITNATKIEYLEYNWSLNRQNN